METHGTSPESAANYRMIDIADKIDTHRRAVASGSFFAAPETISRIRERTLPKGDVLILAEVAGIQGAKRTADLLPLCHPLALTSVRVWCEVMQDQVLVFCEAKTVGKTGVEMEALSGVSAALLCIYDLTKGIDPALRIGGIQLEIKEGGKSGLWVHPGSVRAQQLISKESSVRAILNGVVVSVITLSDRCSRHESQDVSGPTAVQWFEARGAVAKKPIVIPDDAQLLQAEILRLLENNLPQVILTTGGTGLSKRDITPETVLNLSQELGGREIPGMGELLRQSGARHVHSSWLSRSTAVLVKGSLILCLPGSPAAVREGLDAVGGLIQHSLKMASGGGHG